MGGIIAFLVLLAAGSACALSGRVVDTAGKPVPGVAVQLEILGRSTVTDAQGRFSFAVVSAGLSRAPARSGAPRVHPPFVIDRQGDRVLADGRSAAGRVEPVSGPQPGDRSLALLRKRAAASDTLACSKSAFRPRRLVISSTDTALPDIVLHPEFPGGTSSYLGFTQYSFPVGSRNALVVVPKKPAPGNPWIWRTYFWNHKPRFDSIMASQGWHLAFIDAPDLYGAPQAVAAMDAFYAKVTAGHGLASKPTLVGISRGGLYAYRWAMANPGKVSSIYGDAPVMDFVSWPCGCYGTGAGNAGNWSQLKNVYGFASDAEAKAFQGNPYANMKIIAEARIPVIHVYGDVDEVVPAKENTLRAADSLKAHGGNMVLLAKPGIGHTHGLSASDGGKPGQMDTLVQFVRRHTTF